MVQKDSLNGKERILVIGGPTGVGKSAYAVDVALKYNGEIISADSVQVYKNLNIGSGKITTEEMRGVPHHLIDIIDPTQEFSVVNFTDLAKECITDIISRGKLPIVVGGTGFYINALLHGYSCGNNGPDYLLRDRLNRLEAKHGKGYLYSRLLEINKDTEVRKNDMPRIIRQLELALMPPVIDAEDSPMYADMYDALLLIMDADRDKLDSIAVKRIDKMFEDGLLREVRNLENFYSCRALLSVGYHDVRTGIMYGLDDEQIKSMMHLNYHRLIKKQQTFFRWLKWENKVTIYNWDTEEADIAIEEFVNNGLR